MWEKKHILVFNNISNRCMLEFFIFLIFEKKNDS